MSNYPDCDIDEDLMSLCNGSIRIGESCLISIALHAVKKLKQKCLQHHPQWQM